MAKHTLTEKLVRTAKPTTGTTETTFYDGDGLVLRARVNAAGAVLKTWQYWYTAAGKRTRIGLGSYPEVSLTDAREKADRYRSMVQAGITPTHALQPSDAARPLVPRTLDELAERWAADYLALHHKDKGAAQVAAYKRHVSPSIGKTRLLDARKLHVLHVVQPLARDGKSRTAQHTLGMLRQMFQWAIRNDFASIDPTAGLVKSDFGGSSDPRDRHLSPDEIQLLATKLQAARRAGPAGREREIPVLGLPTQAAVWVMLATLARVGELTAARWSDIDLAAQTWTVPAANSKNGLPHLIHVSAFALRHLAHLRQYAAGSEWVMPDRAGTGPLDSKAITKQLRDRQQDGAPLRGRSSQQRALTLPGGPFTAHDMRRTGATLMRAAGVDIAIVERCLNHVEENRLVRTYQRADMLPERAEAFARLGARLDALVPAAMTAHLNVMGGGVE